MAARFYKKGPIPEFTALLNSTYKDLYDNNRTTADIQSGTVNDNAETSMFMADFKLPATPAYGSAELKGGKVAFYINSTGGGTNYSSILKSYKLKAEIGDNEGGKASATGTIVSNKDIVQISAYHSNEHPYIIEDMGADTEMGTSYSLGYSYAEGGSLYLTKKIGYDLGNEYGAESWMGTWGYSRDKHFSMFGTDHPTLGEVYLIEHEPLSIFGTFKTIKKFIMADGRYYSERYSSVSAFGMNSGGVSQHVKSVPGTERGGKSPSMALTSVSTVERELITTKNTIFNKVKEDETFVELNPDGETKEVAFARISKSSTSIKGNNSLHFNSVYPHRYNTTAQVYYSKRFDSVGGSLHDGSENQQISFVSSVIPKPTHLYTVKPVIAGDGKQPVTPKIELDFNIESLAPMLIRNQNGSYAEPAHDYRLTRSIVVTFGEEPARSSDNLFTYFKRHAPNTASSGTGGGTGLGTSAKSFFGVALVKHDGKIGYYNLGNAGKSSSTYTDSTFGIDATRGEVCFAAAPTTLDNDDLIGHWFTISIQLHPDDQGAVWCIHDPETGEIFTENTPYTTQKLTNLKNITASGAGVWANNNDDFPKYMTVWNSNYQSIKGSYNTAAKMYETGLRTADQSDGDGTASTALEVYGVQDSTAVNGTVQKTAGAKYASYLLLDRGDDVHMATSDGSSDSGLETITENSNSIESTFGAGELAITSGQWSADDYIYHAPKSQIPDGQIEQDHFDCINSFYLDEIRMKHFSMIQSNATPTGSVIAPSNLFIPTAFKLENTAWQDGSSTVANIKDNRTQQPSYLCFGFDDLTDLTGPQGLGSFTDATCDTNHTSNTTTVTHDANPRIVAGLQISGTGIDSGAFIVSITDTTHFIMSIAATATNNNQTLTFDAVKFIHMNDYSSQRRSLDSNIITNDDSDISNIRVGYSSSIEKYGRQNAANSTAGSVPDTGSAESAVFSNAETSPTTAFRGLIVGDLDTAANEFSVESNGSGNDGVGNVDYFSQKGLMKWRFGYRKSASITVLDNAGNADMDAGHTEVKVTDGSALSVNDYIMIGSELMLIDVIADDDGDGAFTKATLTVQRAQHGTVAAVQADGSDVYIVAMPEKRECIFASSRILKVENENSLVVSNPEVFRNKENQQYIFYKYNDSHAAPTGFTGNTLKVVSIKDNVVTFNGKHDMGLAVGVDGYTDYLISPKRYWLIVEILNIGGAHGWQDDTDGTTEYLPTKSYDNVVQLFEKGTYGATFNEAKYTDSGDYQNKWHLTLFDDTNDGIADLKDYGFGEYDKETIEGGHNGILAMNLEDVDNTYQYIDLGKTFVTDTYKGSDTLPLLITTGDMNADFKVTFDTELGTNKPYILGQYEDNLPTINSLSIKPNEDNAYNIDFTWECGDTDLWYGFIMVSPDEVNTQYSGAVLNYPMNEDGLHGAKATAPVDKAQGMATAVDSSSTTGPFYDIEGLSGNCLRNNTTGSPAIEIGTGSADPLASTGYTVTDEMTINMHIVPDADVDGTLSQTNTLIGSTSRMYVKMQTDRTIYVQLYWDSNSAITLYSTSKLVCDGETPSNIMVTLDTNLISGNVKLFINGKLEDQTGECIIADATGLAQTSWLFKSNINANNNKIFLGNNSDTGGEEFSGRMEEVVFYNRCLYPVNPNDSKYIFTKPLVELSETSAKTGSKSYSSKIFIKDYHNIRGTTLKKLLSG